MDNTIAGSGSIKADPYQPLHNSALIQADDPLQELTINDVLNSGTLRARNGATLSVGYVENQNGSLQAEDDSLIELLGWVVGGQLTASGTGRFEIPTGYQVMLQDVTNAALLQIDGATLQLDGSGLENRGTVSAQCTYLQGHIQIGGPFLLSGGGTLELLTCWGDYMIWGVGPLTNQDNLIHGGGWIRPTLENHATVRADGDYPLSVPRQQLGAARSRRRWHARARGHRQHERRHRGPGCVAGNRFTASSRAAGWRPAAAG